MPKVSVIIPVYNTEKYLEKCLSSVCGQTLKDIEIIIVNDFSSDNSFKIIEKFAANDDRIKILNFTENKGAAFARNMAINLSKGEYISFVDSDDYISLDFCEKLYLKAKEYDAELSLGVFSQTLKNMKNEVLNNDFLGDVSKNKLVFNMFFAAALYKRDLLFKNDIKFPENCRYGEDRIVALKSAWFANRISLTFDTFYFYVENPDSITRRKIEPETIKNYLIYINDIFDFIFKITKPNDENFKMLRKTFEDDIAGFCFKIPENIIFEFVEGILPLLKRIESKHLPAFKSAFKGKDSGIIKKYLNEQNKKRIFEFLRKKITKKHKISFLYL